jgi:quercetin dioxygenase-like cupin family protein
MELEPARPTAKGPTRTFTGDVYVDPIHQGEEPSRMTVSMVRFTPGAHTNWHSHALGQALHCTDGVGLVVTRDGTVIRLRPGDTVWTPPGQEHWHGAAPDHFHGPPRDARGRRRRRPHHLARTGHRRPVPRRHQMSFPRREGLHV